MKILSELSKCGFSLVRREDGVALKDVRSMIERLHPLKTTFGRLHPLRRADAKPNTLSAAHGLGELPPHSDGAHLPIPPRYFVLFVPRPRSAATLIYRLEDRLCGIETDAERAIFYVRDRHSLFPTPFKTRSSEGEAVYRFNPDIMSPANDSAERVFNALTEKPLDPTVRVDWSENIAVFIDNWRMLHGREAARQSDSSIIRCSIWMDL